MNSNFEIEQIRAYAAAFEDGDAIWCDGEWHEVFREDESLSNASPNQYYIKDFMEKGVIDGFKQEETPYRVTTLEHYELQGGEKIVWLGEDIDLTFGKTYVVESDNKHMGRLKITDDVGDRLLVGSAYVDRFKKINWGIIPRYEQVKCSVKPKFKVGDIVTVKTYKAPATVKEVEERKTTETYVYSVEYNADERMKFWESDLELYRQEEEEGRPASSHYHDNNNGNDVWKFADDNLSEERVKGFHQINAIKYVSRYHKKHDTTEKRIEDLEKAKVSIDKLIELEKKG